MSENIPKVVSRNTVESVSVDDTVYKCGNPACLKDHGKKDTHFNSKSELDEHVKTHSPKVTGSAGCKFCKEPIIFNKKFLKKEEEKNVNGVMKKQVTYFFNENRPDAQIASMGDAMHDECKIAYFKKQGLEVKKI